MFRFPFFSTTRSAPTSALSLPARWKRGRQYAAIASVIWVGLVAFALADHNDANKLDSSWLRARFTLREWLSHMGERPTLDPRIVLVEIDDKSSDAWNNEPIVMWGGHLADAVHTLNRSGARLLAFDWMQSVETDSRMKWNHDERLGIALSQTRDAVFVKFVRANGGYILPTPALLFALPGAIEDGGASRLGFAELPGFDSVQTTILPATNAQELSFAARIASRLGADWKRAPRRDDGSLLINFANNAGARGDDSPFERVSLVDLARSKTSDPRFKDKIVLIGATYKGNNDFHYVPFFDTQRGGKGWGAVRKIAGVELQAHALATLLDGKALREPASHTTWFLTTLLGAFGVMFFTLLSWQRAIVNVLIWSALWTTISFIAFVAFDLVLPLVVPLLMLFMGGALMGGFRAFSEERERAQVLKTWGRFQDPVLIRELLENPDLRSGQGREMEVTVLFADLKHFTKTVEHLSPSDALHALNRYLALFATVIREHGGLVDKYLGDGLMAQWGAPVGRTDHAQAAVMACLDIEKRLETLSAQLQKTGEVTFEARLTLHSGPVVAGQLGSEESLEYTLIGDTVNVTSRLQETAKALGCDFLISETTCESLKEKIKFGRETSVEIRGRTAPLRVFEVIGPKPF